MSSNPILNIQPLLEDGRESELANLLSTLHPADVAEALSPLDMEDTIKVMSLLDIAHAAEVLVELSDSSRDQVTLGLPRDKLTQMVAEMDSDDAADIVGDLSEVSEAAAEEVLQAIGDEESGEVRRLLMYDEETAGGLMQLELVAALATDTVAKVIDEIRAGSEDLGDLGSIYVVDQAKSLQGEVSLKDLLLAYPNQTLADLLPKPLGLVVRVDEDQKTVAQKFKKYDVRSAPVVDSQNRLLGRIMVDDIIDVVDEETDKDFYRLAGSSEEEVYTSGALRRAGLRLPWLLFNLGGGLVTSLILRYFEASFHATMALVAFVPMVMSMSGAVGSQSATITVRGLATGRIAPGLILRSLSMEQKVSGVMALVFGLSILTIAGALHGSFRLGLAVGLSLSSAILVSAFLGAVTPLFFRAVNVDPALASGPVVTSANDVASLLIYATIGTSVV
ncbi:MAG: magnesium transporter [Deltaproteobacteria bacterium]|jgi:magnesium transporter|nr:magnesium transporter [Deltaproteobacteria bacterium]